MIVSLRDEFKNAHRAYHNFAFCILNSAFVYGQGNERGRNYKSRQQLPKLKGCDAHCTVILSDVDAKLLKRLGINVSCEPKYETKKLYHK